MSVRAGSPTLRRTANVPARTACAQTRVQRAVATSQNPPLCSREENMSRYERIVNVITDKNDASVEHAQNWRMPQTATSVVCSTAEEEAVPREARRSAPMCREAKRAWVESTAAPAHPTIRRRAREQNMKGTNRSRLVRLPRTGTRSTPASVAQRVQMQPPTHPPSRATVLNTAAGRNPRGR